MQWLEIKVTTGRDSTEAVAEKLMNLGAGGVCVEDEVDWNTAKRAGLGDIFPVPIAKESGTVTIRGYFSPTFLAKGKDEELTSFLRELPAFGLAPAAHTLQQLNDPGWEQVWKQYWQPTPVGKKLLILPAWLDAGLWPDRQVLRLDPGVAFGTGTHESTQLCLELLETEIAGGETVLDLGCGSGILALAAKLLGAGNVSGVDIEEAAVRTACENAELNGMQVPFIRADLFYEDAWAKPRSGRPYYRKFNGRRFVSCEQTPPPTTGRAADCFRNCPPPAKRGRGCLFAGRLSAQGKTECRGVGGASVGVEGMTRFFYTENQRQGKDTVLLAGEEAHHLLRVLRASVGDSLELCNETGQCRLAEILAAEKNSIFCRLGDFLPDSEASVQFTVAFGLLKGEKVEFVLQKATELGATGFIPFISGHTVVRPEKNMEIRRQRWQKIIRSAAAQSHRNIIPSILPPVSWQQLLELARMFDKAVLFWEGEEGRRGGHLVAY